MLVVLDENGRPLAGEWQFAEVVRDGLVVDFVGATDLLRGMKARLERRLGRELTQPPAATRRAYLRPKYAPPPTWSKRPACDCSGLVDEPSAANNDPAAAGWRHRGCGRRDDRHRHRA